MRAVLCDPNNPYAASKAAVDLLGIEHHLAHGTDVISVRPFNHAGPRQSARYVLAGLAFQVAQVEAGRAGRLEVGNLDIIRDFTDVRDVVRAYRMLAQSGQPGEVYNLGSGAGTRIADALEYLRSLARVPIEIHVDPARLRPVDQPMLVADASKLRAAVGWETRYSIEQTLADMLESWRKVGRLASRFSPGRARFAIVEERRRRLSRRRECSRLRRGRRGAGRRS